MAAAAIGATTVRPTAGVMTAKAAAEVATPARGRAAAAEVSPATPGDVAATSAATSGEMAAAAAASTAATAVLGVSQRGNGRDRQPEQQGAEGADYISCGHVGHHFDHSSSPRFTPSSLPGRWPAIH
jgi:hypothetical protein